MDYKDLGTEFDDRARSIIHYQGGYLLLGYTENTNTGFSEISVYSFETQGYSIRNAERIATVAEAGANLVAEDMVLNANGNIAVIGTREFNNNQDMYLFTLDGEGNLLGDAQQFGELGNQSGSRIDRTPDGGLILTGTNTLEGNSLISLIKTKANGGL